MQLNARVGSLAEVKADWLICPVWEDEDGDASTLFGGEIQNLLGHLRAKGDVTGKPNELVPILNSSGLAAERVLLVGLGKRAGADRIRITDAAAAAAKAVSGKQYRTVCVALPQGLPDLGWEAMAEAVGIGLLQGSYGPGLHKREKTRFAPEKFLLIAPPSAPANQLGAAARRAEIIGKRVVLARDLVNTPPCDLYPETFAERARQAATAVNVECTILDEKQLETERMGALLGVARGSERPPRLVVLRYRHGGAGPTLGLVGKGVTFDSGGLSLKTNDQMVDMKCDMAGAATVLAAVTASAELHLPVNLLGVLPLVENLPGGRAFKLGDVLHTRSGKTIEVLNTDAEGRLILADALTYAVDQKVNHLVDLATLTGACVVALGVEVAGVMSNNDIWCERVLAAARQAGERAWPLPMYPLYDDMIKSHVADMKNTGGTRYGGAISAAKLLEQFVAKVPWAHLDIAGPAWAEHESPMRDPGGTGCFVRTLVELAQNYGQE